MKKTRFLVLALIIALALAGAGYAWWTDRLEHNVSISTGELNVEFTNQAHARKEVTFMSEEVKELGLEDNFVVGKIDRTKKTVSFTFDGAYPGTEMSTHMTAVNKGTIPAYFQRVNTDLKAYNANNEPIDIESSKLANAMEVTYLYYIKKQDDAPKDARVKRNGSCSLLELPEALSEALEGEYLKPGEELTFGDPDTANYKLIFKIPGTSLDGDDGENEKLIVAVSYDFVQHNAYIQNGSVE